jgi:hypothetical protein
MSFRNDLKLGEFYERQLINHISSTHVMDKIKGRFSAYDVAVMDDFGREVKYECKCDRLAQKTGNLAIEYECNNKPSGISTTESDFYGYFIIREIGYDLYLIPTEEIRTSIINKEYKRVVNGGDGWKSKMYLFELETFKKYLYVDKNKNVIINNI